MKPNLKPTEPKMGTQNWSVLINLKMRKKDKWPRGLDAQFAFKYMAIMRLAARIGDLRAMGWEIVTERKTGKNRYGERVSFAEYKLL